MKQHIPDIPNKESIPVIPTATLSAMEKFFADVNIVKRIVKARESEGGEQVGEGPAYQTTSRSITKRH